MSQCLAKSWVCGLQNVSSQLVLALCRDSERIPHPSAGLAAVEDALSFRQRERQPGDAKTSETL